MLGSKDKLFTVAMANNYKAKMEDNAKRCDLNVLLVFLSQIAYKPL